MHSHLQRMFAATLLTVCIGAPALEMFDRWDHTLQDGNDTESNLVVVALCVGIGFVAAAAIVRRFRAPLTDTITRVVVHIGPLLDEASHTPPVPHASPPLALRI